MSKKNQFCQIHLERGFLPLKLYEANYIPKVEESYLDIVEPENMQMLEDFFVELRGYEQTEDSLSRFKDEIIATGWWDNTLNISPEGQTFSNILDNKKGTNFSRYKEPHNYKIHNHLSNNYHLCNKKALYLKLRVTKKNYKLKISRSKVK